MVGHAATELLVGTQIKTQRTSSWSGNAWWPEQRDRSYVGDAGRGWMPRKTKPPC